MKEVHDNSDDVWKLYLDRPEDFNFTFNYLFPARQGPIPALGHIGRREGIDDYRYVYTLKQLIKRAAAGEDAKGHKAAKEAEKALDAILSKICIAFYPADVFPGGVAEMEGKGILRMLGDWHPDGHIPDEDYSKFRREIAGQIMALQDIIGK